MAKKRSRSTVDKTKTDAAKNSTEELPPPVRQSEDEPEAKKSKWINKQRVLIFGCRGLGSRDRHLMEDMRTLMPHSKSDSKMHRKKEGSLFVLLVSVSRLGFIPLLLFCNASPMIRFFLIGKHSLLQF